VDRLGRYSIVKRLVEGRTTEIFFAKREEAGGFSRSVVIKAMTDRFVRTGDAVRAFLQETRITGMLHHPNVVAAYDVDEHRGRYFMALERVPGWNLRAVMATLSLRQQLMPVDVAMAIVAEAAAGLDYAHGCGIVHRDVTPSNVMLGEQGYVKVLDFGGAICEQVEVARPQRADVVSRYSAPELLRNGPVDGRADVYSLGALLFELTTGGQLFVGDDPLRQIANGDIPRPGSLRRGYPPSLETLVTRALSSAPEPRFESPRALHRALISLAVANKFPLSSVRVGDFLTRLFDNAARTPATSVLRNTGRTRVRLKRKRRRLRAV
jgi:serine/threonine-protein kinase